MELSIFQQLGVAVVLSGLIGLERERRSQLHEYKSFGGIRTFSLIGLLGALSYMLSLHSPVIFAVLTAGFLGLLIASYVMTNMKSKVVGATSEIAAIMVYIIGIMSAMENYLLATSVALISVAILHFKRPLHDWAKDVKNVEILSTIEFVLIAFIVLPLLPNTAFGPYEFFNPYIIWLMVVFISGISFISYIAIKLFGAKRGILFSGFFGGLISSTALTLSFSGQSKKNKSLISPYVVAVVIASSAMFVRVLVEVAILNPVLVKMLLLPMLSMAAVGSIAILYFILGKDGSSHKKVKHKPMKLESPFSLWPALKFGMFFASILFFAKFAQATMGDKGLYITSFVSGLLDVDAITVSVATLAKGELSTLSAVTAITIAAMTNTVAKAGMFFVFGARKAAIRIAVVFTLMLIAGGVSLLFI